MNRIEETELLVKNENITQRQNMAPGWPGIPSQWMTSSKTTVGTALNPASRVWFTISHGILTELYYPRVDQACTRDMGFIVTDGKSFFSEEKTHTNHEVTYLAEGVPAVKITNTCKQGNYKIEKEIITDPETASVLQRVKLIPLKKKLKDLKLYALCAPHIGNLGSGNNAFVGEHKGKEMLFAERDNLALAMACSVKLRKLSVGYVGFSDGWQDLNKHKHLKWQFRKAENGNVALVGEIDLTEVTEEGFVLTIAFGNSTAEAGQRAIANLFEDFNYIRDMYITEWQVWQEHLIPINGLKKSTISQYLISASVLRVHESKRRTGGLIASLSIPWGSFRGDEDYGGYHLVWPRDLVNIGGGLLAIGANYDARKTLEYLMLTQEEDGHWPQNMWLDGTPYWTGVQMDQVALPIIFLDIANREGALKNGDLYRFWPMVQKAAQYLVCNGPETPQCRWEENSGYSVYTLATEIAALLIAAEIAEINDQSQMASYMRETADLWNSNIEKWTYVKDTKLAKNAGVEGYYMRIAPRSYFDRKVSDGNLMTIVNRLSGENIISADEMISPDALALVRFGLRDAKDPKILNTIKVIDEEIKKDLPGGPCWYRYNGDGYGEHADGRPFDGSGIGRVWPLLTGERGHYEVAAGNYSKAKEMIAAMESFSNEGGMFPEQIWDQEDIPEKELFYGKATGAAMPLAWAHSEYIKLCRSVKLKKVFDMPTQTHNRYIKNKNSVDFEIFRFSHKISEIFPGKKLRIETLSNAEIRWTTNQWKTVENLQSIDSGLGVFFTDLPINNLPSGTEIEFTFYWPEVDKWEDENFIVKIG